MDIFQHFCESISLHLAMKKKRKRRAKQSKTKRKLTTNTQYLSHLIHKKNTKPLAVFEWIHTYIHTQLHRQMKPIRPVVGICCQFQNFPFVLFLFRVWLAMPVAWLLPPLVAICSLAKRQCSYPFYPSGARCSFLCSFSPYILPFVYPPSSKCL